MRILLTPVGSAGDHFPFIGMAHRLQQRGHDVTLAANGHFTPLIKRLGLNVCEVSTQDEHWANINDPNLFHPIKGFSHVMKSVAQIGERIFDLLKSWQEMHGNDFLIVAGSLDFASRAFAEKYAIPLVSAHLQPAIMRTIHQMPTQGRFNLSFMPKFIKRLGWNIVDWMLLDRHAGAPFNAARLKLSLPPVKHVFADPMHPSLLSIGMWPEWFGAPQPDYPKSFKLTGFPLFDGAAAQPVSDAVEQFLNAGEPPLVFTPGTAMVYGQDFFKTAVAAAYSTGKRAMLLTRHPEQIPKNLPPTIRHFEFAPLSQILKRCALLIHHGGIGTTSAALAASIPQIISPFSHDQPDNAWRIRKLGVGDRIMPKQFTARRLAKSIIHLTTAPDVYKNCIRTAREISGNDGLARACDLIDLVATRTLVLSVP